MTHSQVAGCEKQLTHWAHCFIITPWVVFILPLQHLILQTLKHRYFSKVKTENGFDPRIPSLAIQKVKRTLSNVKRNWRRLQQIISALLLSYATCMQEGWYSQFLFSDILQISSCSRHVKEFKYGR